MMFSSGVATGPELCSFTGVELAKTGVWDALTGKVAITRADLAAAVASAAALPAAPLKLGHTDPRFDGDPALGWVTNLRLADNGHTLVGDLVDIPAWFAEIMPTAFSHRSIEATFNLDTPHGVHRFAVTALSLLGATWPAITDLASLRDHYTQGETHDR